MRKLVLTAALAAAVSLPAAAHSIPFNIIDYSDAVDLDAQAVVCMMAVKRSGDLETFDALNHYHTGLRSFSNILFKGNDATDYREAVHNKTMVYAELDDNVLLQFCAAMHQPLLDI